MRSLSGWNQRKLCRGRSTSAAEIQDQGVDYQQQELQLASSQRRRVEEVHLAGSGWHVLLHKPQALHVVVQALSQIKVAIKIPGKTSATARIDPY